MSAEAKRWVPHTVMTETPAGIAIETTVSAEAVSAPLPVAPADPKEWGLWCKSEGRWVVRGGEPNRHTRDGALAFAAHFPDYEARPLPPELLGPQAPADDLERLITDRMIAEADANPPPMLEGTGGPPPGPPPWLEIVAARRDMVKLLAEHRELSEQIQALKSRRARVADGYAERPEAIERLAFGGLAPHRLVP